LPFYEILSRFTLNSVLVDQSLYVSSHSRAEDLAASEVSLSLCGLLTKVMSVIRVENLYLASTGYGKSLGRCLMCLDLSHFYISFR